ncbi:AAA family ATPase [Parageobacillus thermoglucosidasius]|uniref:AAA family ATPase n=2 Tax=Anoxybacillaceae TaxID=3120669 RepID=A0AAN0YLN8_PARTM|nr:MoxR family ATPase [Parageobacillus thermoglucosidasius]ALF09354.1 AAA family ATPase [Parageobacillus thermoglucosidasius]ANZ29437.1 AAA family ATPase [Parageobacillus thermoglucosidasius]APM80174.1 AAA family ATPase [Parageobacillus thermoglucosidasius]KJX67319.1 ATPase AAA [Parageobacillus thermoglucosidasius]MED4906597.1 MoxR family ATPase [Parageobacillus thermoglucosidasius]
MKANEALHLTIARVVENIEKVIIGKRDVAILSIVALLAKGHVLLEDVPGVGKTMLVRALAKSVNAQFKRIQFTPDLLPSDVIGVSVYNQKAMQFEYKPGPIMGNIVLADEINRTSPKTQSALLEAMEEGNVTVDGVTRPLPRPFFVMATQNPIEYEGTYPLPEAQLDRFMLKLKMGYPSLAEEIEMLNRSEKVPPIEEIEPVITMEELLSLQKQVADVYVDESVKRYIVEMVQQSRADASVYLGVSPRGSVALMKAAQAYAFVHGRGFVIPDDVQFLAPYVLSHRIIVKSEAKFDGFTAEEIVAHMIKRTPVPIQR